MGDTILTIFSGTTSVPFHLWFPWDNVRSSLMFEFYFATFGIVLCRFVSISADHTYSEYSHGFHLERKGWIKKAPIFSQTLGTFHCQDSHLHKFVIEQNFRKKKFWAAFCTAPYFLSMLCLSILSDSVQLNMLMCILVIYHAYAFSPAYIPQWGKGEKSNRTYSIVDVYL